MNQNVGDAPRLDIGQVIRSVFAILKADGASLTPWAVVIVGLPFVIGTGILWWQTTSNTPVFWLNAFFVSLPTVIGFSVVHAIIVWRLLARPLGRSPALDRAGNGSGFVWKVALLIGLTDVCLLVAAGVLVVPGFFLMVIWIVALPALLVERRGVNDALQRSAVLTRGNRWRVFALVLLYGVVAMVLETVVTALTDGVTLYIPLTIALDWIVFTISSIAIAVVQALVGGVGIVAIYRALVPVEPALVSEQTAAVFD